MRPDRLVLFVGLLACVAAATAGAQVFPGGKTPEKNLLLVDVDEQPREVQFLVYTLEGLVNRESPRIYVKDDRYEGGADAALARRIFDWGIPILEQRGHTFEKVADYRSLLEKFKSSYSGALVYDDASWHKPELADQINIVTALCATRSLLPVTPELNEQLKLPVVMDVRGRWKSAEEAYRWAVGDDALKRAINHQVLAHRHPWSLYMTDYLVAESILPVWIGKDWRGNNSLSKLQRDLFALTPANTPVIGSWQSDWPKSPPNSSLVGMDETALVKLCSASGKFFIPCLSGGNFSVHAGIDMPEIKQKPHKCPRFDPQKVYVTFIASGGGDVSAFMLIRPLLWKDPNRGKVPLGWTFPPSLLDLAPHLLAAYYADASPDDCFVAGSSGLGLIMPPYAAATRHPDKVLSDYLNQTAKYLEATDARLEWNGWTDAAMTKQFAQALPLDGLFVDREPFKGSYRDSIGMSGPTSRPVAIIQNTGSASSGLASEGQIHQIVNAIRSRAGWLDRPRFIFVGFNGLTGTPTNVLRVAQELPKNYLVVRPDDFVHLYKQAVDRQMNSRSAEERLIVQTHAPYSPRLRLNADVAVCYGIDNTLPERIESWRNAGYGVSCMTGVAWGDYQDYLSGRWDGVKHEDQVQTDAKGRKIGHGGDVYYISPDESYGKYLSAGVKRAIDAGATAIYLEEPEYWVRAGYSPNFKKEWKSYYGDDWQPPDSSPDAQYRASELKYYLYRRTLGQICDFVHDYSKKIRRQVRCYVATHSMINYAHWGIVSPESSLGHVNCDGYIAQVWTGTERTPNLYDGLKKERTFETGFLEYGQMENLVRGTNRRIWFLHDPVEDDPNHSWADYRANWQSTVTASLMHPEVWRYQTMPWPERVWKGLHPTTQVSQDKQGEKIDMEKIPQAYETEIQAVDAALGDMRQSNVSWEVAGTRKIGVLVSDTMMFERGEPSPPDPDLSSFFGLALPLLKAGIPVTPVQLEDVSKPGFLVPFKVLLLTYEGQKPPKPELHEALAHWVKRGGALVVIDNDKDPYNAVKEWWNTGKNHYKTPRAQLFEQLGIAPAATGLSKVGDGVVLFVKESPAALAHDPNGGGQVRRYTAKACGAIGLKYEQTPSLILRRGPYVVAAGLDEPAEAGGWPRVLKGRFLSLFDDGIPLVTNPAIEPGKRYLYLDIDRCGPAPRVVASAGRVRNSVKRKDTFSFQCEGIQKTQAIVCILLTTAPREVELDGKKLDSSAWQFDRGILRLHFENQPAGVEVKVRL